MGTYVLVRPKAPIPDSVFDDGNQVLFEVQNVAQIRRQRTHLGGRKPKTTRRRAILYIDETHVLSNLR